jgi:hypothetical protein
MSALLRQVLSLTLAALSSPVQAGSRRNASRSADAARLSADGWAAARRELDAAAEPAAADGTRRAAEPTGPRTAGEGGDLPATDRIKKTLTDTRPF